MTKTLIIPKSQEQIFLLQDKIDGLILGVQNYSVNFEKTFTMEEIKKIRETYHGEIFLSINKNILNKELSSIENLLKECNNESIQGILFYDLAILSLKKKLNLHLPLIWAQEHFTTNYATIAYYEKEGVEGTFLSSDITLNEIIQIREKTKSILMTTIFGYLPMFVSRRHLVDNYKKTFHLTMQDKAYFISKGKEKYRIIDDKNGTFIYSSKILNGAYAYPLLEEKAMDYVLCNSFGIEENLFEEIVSLFKQISIHNKDQIQEKIHRLCNENTSTGFLEKETIFKVKKT